MIKIGLPICLLFGALVLATGSLGQTYTPINLASGFNHDGIAESGTDATAVTSTALDLSTNIMYSDIFAAINALGGGLPSNGTITSGANKTWQLQPYTGNNIMYLSLGGLQPNTAAWGTFNLAAPARYSTLNLLLFSTENESNINVIISFTDGSSFNAGNFFIRDWFGGTPFIYSAYGRTTRRTAQPYVTDGVSTNNPRFYEVDVPLNCVNKNKLVQSVTISYLSGTSAAGRLVALALSGVGYTPAAVTSTLTQATCGNANGTAALTVANGKPNFTYSWNTTPQQTTATATGLAAGNYVATITEGDNCTVTHSVTIQAAPVATLQATANPTAICSGDQAALSVTAQNGTVATYNWTPGNTTGSSINVTPAATTTYTVSGTDNNNCPVSTTVAVTVKPTPTSTFTVAPQNGCLGTVQTITYSGNAGSSAMYDWSNFAGATVRSGSGAGPYTIEFANTGNYTLQLQVTDNGCLSTITTSPVVISTPVSASFDISESSVCAGSIITVRYTGSGANVAIPNWGWGGGTVVAGSGFGPYTVRYDRAGLITLNVRDGSCSSNAPSASIAVIPSPAADFEPSVTTGCAPLVVKFNNRSQSSDAWKWELGSAYTTNDKDPSFTYNTPGLYSVKLIAYSQGRCTDTIERLNLINVKDYPVASFTTNPLENVPVELHDALFNFTNTSQGGLTYKWEFGDGTTSATTSAAHQYQYPGNYVVTLHAYNDIGCENTATKQYMMVLPDKVLEIPNVFSPNGDGTNDTWEIAGLRGVTNCTVEIFNRYGQQVYNSHGYNNPWDGSWKGKQVPVGTFYYVIKTVSRNYNGWVAVIR